MIEGQIEHAVELLREGKLVAFPTETVYGLGADATNASAIRRIFAAKGRPSTNPLICHVLDESMARQYAMDWPHTASAIAAKFWPGPITVVVRKTSAIPLEATAGRETVGLRAPNHPRTLELLRAFGKPIAGPSANKANRISPTTAQHVRDELGDAVDMILDGGPCTVGIESTVLDLSEERATILRPGGISQEQVEAVIGHVDLFAGSVSSDSAAASPGQQSRHYAPRTPAIRVAFGSVQSAARLDRGLIALNPLHDRDRWGHAVQMSMEAQIYARDFYAALRTLDSFGLIQIVIELPPLMPEWSAIVDRITRATTAPQLEPSLFRPPA